MSRRRADKKAGILGIALVAVGLVEAAGDHEDGDNLLEAAGKAVRRTRRRVEILSATEKRLAAEEKQRKGRRA